MIVYNVTVQVDQEIEQEWLKWMQEKHIPQVMATGMFSDHNMYRVLSHNHEGTQAYAIQYMTDSLEDYETYQQKYAQKLQKEHTDKYGDKATAFRTILKQL